MKEHSKYNNILQFDKFPSVGLFHFSTTIDGGVSKGNYATFNLGNLSDDNPHDVYRNRQILAEIAGVLPDNLFIPHQTHSDKIEVLDVAFLALDKNEQTARLEGVDALITDQPGICIGVTTADCVPVLIFDPGKKVLAAVHAGWKGTVKRIAAKTVNLMTGCFGSNAQHIQVGIAPSISPSRFEVGDEVGEAFSASEFNLDDISFRNPETGKLHIDLWKANAIQLIEAGICAENIEIAGICTMSCPDRFFSARRQSVHSGRMLTGGVIR